MRVVAGEYTIILTPVGGEPTEPGRYLGMVPRYLGHQDGPGMDTVVVEWARDGRSGQMWPTAAERGAIWTHRVTVVASEGPDLAPVLEAIEAARRTIPDVCGAIFGDVPTLDEALGASIRAGGYLARKRASGTVTWDAVVHDISEAVMAEALQGDRGAVREELVELGGAVVAMIEAVDAGIALVRP